MRRDFTRLLEVVAPSRSATAQRRGEVCQRKHEEEDVDGASKWRRALWPKLPEQHNAIQHDEQDY
jgi:hypothetical protein